MAQQRRKLAYIIVGLVVSCFSVAGMVRTFEAQTRAAKSTPPRAKTQIVPAPALQSLTQFEGLMGGQIDLASYRGKVILVVNTASQCGFTGQYSGLEQLYRGRLHEGLVIVGVPSNDFGGQEPGSASEIKRFCELNYGVSFPMAAKNVVSGPRAHPFFRNAVALLGPSAEPAWNFHKILIGKNGQPIRAFPSGTTPNAPELSGAITAALAART